MHLGLLQIASPFLVILGHIQQLHEPHFWQLLLVSSSAKEGRPMIRSKALSQMLLGCFAAQSLGSDLNTRLVLAHLLPCAGARSQSYLHGAAPPPFTMQSWHLLS